MSGYSTRLSAIFPAGCLLFFHHPLAETRNHVTGLTRECIGYENGVLGGVIAAVSSFAAPGDAVLLHSPTYIGFTGCLTNNGFKIIHSPLAKDENGIWRMDYADMDAKLKANHIHVAVFCSPHNPCGRVWERWEIEKKQWRSTKQMTVSSSLMKSGLTSPGRTPAHSDTVGQRGCQTPYARLFYAPSKTFNLAGLVGSYHIVYDSYLRDRLQSKSSKAVYNETNVLSVHALIGAYRAEGYQWVDELRQVLSENVRFACETIWSQFEGIEVSRPQGTYMLFLDCEKWCLAHGKTMDELLKAGWDVGVGWQDGRPFHGTWSIRVNLALPFSRVEEAFRRLKEYVF